MRLALFEGDGIGQEVSQAARRLAEEMFRFMGITHEIVTVPVGWSALCETGSTFPSEALAAAREADGIILGPLDLAHYPAPGLGGLDPERELIRELRLHSRFLPARTYAGVTSPFRPSVDLLVVRDNTDGMFADRGAPEGPFEMMPTPDLALSTRKVTREGIENLARSAFETARFRRQHVTAAHQADAMPVSEGLFLQTMRDVAADYPEVEYHEESVDRMAAWLERDPARFDVIVTTSLFGRILSQQAAQVTGSHRISASLSAGYSHVMARAHHGPALSLAGQNVANPTSMLSSTGFMMAYLGHQAACDRLIRVASTVQQTLTEVLARPEWRTADLHGPLSTHEYTDLVIELALARLGAAPVA
ncbi:isocitrate/isopropylmalate family dehydrogenase [Citricoccus muralis]|uniref:Isocitrate/isopropylmalate family dehydrogenase n=1 Tax=Citricoccus muralis TaxID=169134 RepID=A0ABY8H746_9MICC|nr:isocitrate/isopropylmalate family dehydrogenase [Citricoccus muralis]WFP16751.1 isocitrate/isopropylmalate family dehydrogenase [Citricoccus muralis]